MTKGILETPKEEELPQAVDRWISLKTMNINEAPLTQFVTTKTEELLYLIPQNMFFLESEYCAEFYLTQRGKIEECIYSYRIFRNISYIAYLTNYCRLRCFAFNRKRLVQNAVEITVSYDELKESKAAYAVDCDEEAAEEIPEVLESLKPETSISEAYRKIMVESAKARNGLEAPPDPALDPVISDFLDNSRNRCKLLLYVMSCCSSIPGPLQKNLARAYSVSPDLFTNLSLNMYELSLNKYSEKNAESERIMVKHWIRYITLSSAIKKAPDEKSRKELRYQQKKALEKVRARQNAKRKNRGLSYRQLASFFNLAPGTVCRYVNEMKAFLNEIAK